VLELLRRIPRTRKVTAQQLREDLANSDMVVDERTIRRKLAMCCNHFGVKRDDGRPAGYWRPGGIEGLTLAALSEQEALLLMLAKQHLAAFLPPSVTRVLDPFFAEARQNLDPFGDAALAKQWLSKVLVVSATQKLLPPKIGAGVLDTVSQSLYANRWLRLRYKDRYRVVSDKRVMPLGLAQEDSRLYLACQYATGEERSLALHRMSAVRSETLTFERPAFDFQQFVDNGGLSFGKGERVRLIIRIRREDGAHLYETWLSEDQAIVEDGDWLIVTATVTDSLKLKRWMYGYSDALAEVRMERVTDGTESTG
jgi:predicted DNA-binding transcriptional regulator YafY